MTEGIFHELSIENISAYVESQPHIRARVGQVRQVTQSGEGKINGVFFVLGTSGSVVLKQGLPWVRTLPDWQLTIERVACEASLLRKWSGFNSAFIPELWQYDDQRYILAMENLTGHRLLRDMLATSAATEELGSSVGKMMARTAFFTSTFSMSLREHSAAVQAGQNPEMSQLMEDVVFNLPFSLNDSNNNDPAISAHRAQLVANSEAAEAVRRLKWISATRQEALIHGDLHTGSIMVDDSDVRVIDAEFGHYGPIAWDIGEFWAHMFIAAEVHEVQNAPDMAAATLEAIGSSRDSFRTEILQLTTNKMDSEPTRSWISVWLDETESLAMQFAGVEVLRRIIGVGECEQLISLSAKQKEEAIAALIHRGTVSMVNGNWPIGRTLPTASGKASEAWL